MKVKLLHYWNKTTDEEYIVLSTDKEEYGETGYILLNEIDLGDMPVSLPTNTVLSKRY